MSMLARCKRLWTRGAFIRPPDRVERALVLSVLIVALALVPVALTAASDAYAARASVAQAQAQQRHATVATLVRDAPQARPGSGLTHTAVVPARWTAGGVIRTGEVRADAGLRAGAEVPIWLDETGNPTDRPATVAGAAMAGFVVALLVWLTGAALCAVVCILGVLAVNRWRRATWTREWARVEPQWSRRW
ncbi:MAG TPA: hypothetical protein VGX25_00445 [Actinophytocola sp.]|uniref:Rv1733c family protein n=1 Tax=Actinophytocola sp. TaxID=1872138 RepID=UPI002DDD5B1A|nr:hypothetical protein [Actinophytocola sp.]HEV2777847.1 hypothetical protein [Actinophytocola sp.]